MPCCVWIFANCKLCKHDCSNSIKIKLKQRFTWLQFSQHYSWYVMLSCIVYVSLFFSYIFSIFIHQKNKVEKIYWNKVSYQEFTWFVHTIFSVWQISIRLSNCSNTGLSASWWIQKEPESGMCQSIIIWLVRIILFFKNIFVLWMVNVDRVNFRFETNTETINHKYWLFSFIIVLPELDRWIGYVLSDTILEILYVNVYRIMVWIGSGAWASFKCFNTFNHLITVNKGK